MVRQRAPDFLCDRRSRAVIGIYSGEFAQNERSFFWLFGGFGFQGELGVTGIRPLLQAVQLPTDAANR